MPTITRDQVKVPADVMPETRETYIDNYMKATRGTGRLMLFACDQKIEHLNKDFYGEGIDISDAEPEHLFEIGSQGTIGVLAGQRGLVAQYAPDYPEINYLIKMNSKTNLVKGSQDDPYSPQLYDLEAVLAMREAGVNIVGLGYTIYLGSEYESTMMAEAGELIAEAHAAGLLVVLWIYPRGKAVTDEKDPDLIAGAAGVALCLGADFVKVNPPHEVEGQTSAEGLAIASKAAGRTGLVCAGGSKADANVFLTELHNQIHIGGACGNATGRNIHMRSTEEALRLCNAISAITLGDWSVEDAEAKRISRSKRRNHAACCSGGTGEPQRARHGAKANALPFSIFQCSPGRRSLTYLRTGNIGAGTVSPSDIQSPACNQLRKQGFFVRHTQAGKRYPPLYSQYFAWASRLVRCDFFRAAIKEMRKEREGEEKLLRMRQ